MVTITNPLEFIVFSLVSLASVIIFAGMAVLSAIVFIPDFSNAAFGSIMMIFFGVCGMVSLYFWAKWFWKGLSNLRKLREEEIKESLIRQSMSSSYRIQ